MTNYDVAFKNSFPNYNKHYNGYTVAPSFKAGEAAQAAPSTDAATLSTANVQPEQKPEKKGIIRRFKDFVGGVKKFFIGVGEYTKGTVKGLFYGAIGAAGVLAADALRNGAKAIKSVRAQEAVESFKYLSTPGKIVAGAVGLAVLGYQLFKSSLNVSERKSDVDHRWGGGHNNA